MRNKATKTPWAGLNIMQLNEKSIIVSKEGTKISTAP
jgi:hypothetical protein